MACILQCARPFSPGRSTSSSRTSTKFSSCSTSTNWPQYHLWMPTLFDPQPPTITSSLLGSVRFSPFSGQSGFELICPLPSTSTSSTTYSNLDDFYTTYDFGSDVSTSMACSVTSTSDFFTKLAHTYGLIRLNCCAEKTTAAFAWFFQQFFPARHFWYMHHVYSPFCWSSLFNLLDFPSVFQWLQTL